MTPARAVPKPRSRHVRLVCVALLVGCGALPPIAAGDADSTPGDYALVGVVYTAANESPVDPASKLLIPDVGVVRVVSNAASSQDTVMCTGAGVVKVCPTAKITVKQGEMVIPQTLLHLKGDGSKAQAGGQILKYKWTAKQPVGSNQVFVPGPIFPNPTFTAFRPKIRAKAASGRCLRASAASRPAT